jgi:TET-Associated Glycosyltransferase
MNPAHPVFIVSKGRWESRLTSKALEGMGVPYRIVVEQQEYEQYAAVIEPAKILILPNDYLENYDTFDEWGVAKSVGPGAARNYCWDLAVGEGAAWHWVLDDNLDAFHRMNRNSKHESDTGTTFRCAEDFVERYENIAIAGFNYYSFCKAECAAPAYTLNTRIYSCLLIRNDIPYRWRGRYNEDTDLCLRVLKDGWCTLQFNAFLCGKITTQRMTGGNTGEFYELEGTRRKSELLAQMHPDVARVVWRFNRWHHHVDYRPFRQNVLRRKAGLVLPTGINNYGMVLKPVNKELK